MVGVIGAITCILNTPLFCAEIFAEVALKTKKDVDLSLYETVPEDPRAAKTQFQELEVSLY